MSDTPDTPLLDTVNLPADLRKLAPKQLRQLADELRAETISAVGTTGGHLGSGLGYRILSFSSPDGLRQVTVSWTASPIDYGADPRLEPAQQVVDAAVPILRAHGVLVVTQPPPQVKDDRWSAVIGADWKRFPWPDRRVAVLQRVSR